MEKYHYSSAKVLLLILISLCGLSVCAQTEQGAIMTGSNMSLGYTAQAKIRTFDMNINPNFGYCLFRNFMAGAAIGIGITSDNRGSKGENRLFLSTSFVPFLRYYFLKEKIRPFVFGRFGYLGTTTLIGGGVGNVEGVTGGGGLGVNYFLNQHTALEATLGYNGTWQKGTATSSRFGFGLGLQVFFKPKTPLLEK